MAEDNRNKGNDPRVGDLTRRVIELEKKVAEAQAPVVVNCAFCLGTGNEPDHLGRPLIDDNDRAVPCRICKGTGKVRL